MRIVWVIDLLIMLLLIVYIQYMVFVPRAHSAKQKVERGLNV